VHSYSATDPALEIVGALFLEPADGAVRPHRQASPYLGEVPTAFMRLMIAAAAGVRARFSTTATRLSVRLAVHPIEIADAAPMIRPPSIWSSMESRWRHAPQRVSTASRGPAPLNMTTDALRLQLTDVVTAAFEDLRDGEKTVEVWLPHTAIVDLVGADRDAEIRAADPSTGTVDPPRLLDQPLPRGRPANTDLAGRRRGPARIQPPRPRPRRQRPTRSLRRPHHP
jgi:hypothetical protein